MTELILKNEIDKKRLDSLLLFLKSWNVDVEVKASSDKDKKIYNPFSETCGIWEDYDINIKKIRQQSYERRTKSHDHDTL
jgi:hypothetical protein